ncbi:MAG: SDR family oxidoreductase [Hylemonella sp.]
MANSLNGKVAVVSGASAGIGQAISRQLAALGVSVIALGRNDEALKALASEFAPGRIQTMPGDLNHAEYLSKLDASVARVDYFINNAGILTYAPLMELDDHAIADMFQTNVLASIQLTRILAKKMIAQKQGHIVFMTSTGARSVFKLAIGYCATKHALAAFANGFRLELQSDGIKVTEVAPGMVDTNIRSNSTHPAVAAALGARKFSPLSPDEVAQAVVYALQSNSNACPDLIELRPQGAY